MDSSKSIILAYFNQEERLQSIAIKYSEYLAIVPPKDGLPWLLILRKHGMILHQASSLESCCYLAMLLEITCKELDDFEELCTSLAAIFRSTENIVSGFQDLREQRYKMFYNGEIAGK